MPTMMDMNRLREWIGRSETEEEVLSTRIATQFAVTLDLPGEWTEGAEAPPMIHWCLAQGREPTRALADDGHPPRGGFLPPVTLPRRMWAGGELSFAAPLRVGGVVERRSTVVDVVAKEGRSGPLCFVTVEHVYRCDGVDALTERQDIVYREAASTHKPSQGQKAPEGRERRSITPSRALLFRYSAVTFNAHRIHYDIAYAREDEGYPGLVVHGPLQATLLCQYARTLSGKPPRRFAFRSHSPVFDTSDFTLNATQEGEVMQLWTAQANSPRAMVATATW